MKSIPYRVTDDDGRASAFLTSEQFVPGYYKMRFGVGGYFASNGADTFFPFAEVVDSAEAIQIPEESSFRFLHHVVV